MVEKQKITIKKHKLEILTLYAIPDGSFCRIGPMDDIYFIATHGYDKTARRFAVRMSDGKAFEACDLGDYWNHCVPIKGSIITIEV